MVISGEDSEAVVLLKARVPQEWDSLGDARETARCIEAVFRGVKAQVVSVQKLPDVGAMKRI
jgi:hypothetical protein